MPPAKSYTVLHRFATRVNEDTGEEGEFLPGVDYDGPKERIEHLLEVHEGQDPDGSYFRGPLIAEKASEPAKQAQAQAKEREKAQADPAKPADDTEGN